MTPYRQTIFGRGKDLVGNSLSTCIGCLLDVPPDRIPNFANRPEWRLAVNDWLSKRNLFYVECTIDPVTAAVQSPYWGFHVIAGESEKAHWHCVIGHQGSVYHDPYPGNKFLEGFVPSTYGFLVPKVIGSMP